MDQTHYFGGGGDTFVTPIVLVVICVAILLILFLPRRFAMVPFLVGCVLIPVRQVVVVAGFHFMPIRILATFGWVRLGFSRLVSDTEDSQVKLNALDRSFILWVSCSVVMFTILWGEWGAFVRQAGFLYDAFGGYFLLRLWMRHREDTIRTMCVLAVICLILGICMASEQLTARNLFGTLGAFPEEVQIRGTKLRAQGPFLHPLLAGTFGAVLFPVFVGLSHDRRSRAAGLVGCCSSVWMTVASGSSTPVLALVAGIAGVCLWPLRGEMRVLRWGIVCTLATLHMVMKAPVWALIARVDVSGGSSGYHRYMLLDQFIRRFSEWWLLGTTTTASWGFDMWDTINSYVAAGTNGGLLTLTLFVGVIVCAFKVLGAARSRCRGAQVQEKLLWGLESGVFANVVAFFGIGYFDQSVLGWYALLALAGSSFECLSSPNMPVRERKSSSQEFRARLGRSPVRLGGP